MGATVSAVDRRELMSCSQCPEARGKGFKCNGSSYEPLLHPCQKNINIQGKCLGFYPFGKIVLKNQGSDGWS
ncbi:hypothetical protein C0Q70_06811 [Pomacea canaliculata]|uniref:Uncharacterized protein n=1 Tax=Pomacea canaliculata TaxID=400727 RepID=A0A2T7PDB4_POMCA|nr:hypothetical protein C0Q70_06811 [Pomacea canaliculata]